MELRFSSEETKQRLFDIFPSGIVVVRSVGTDEISESRCLYVTEYVAS